MRVLVDGLPLYGTSVSITAGHLLTAWSAAFPADELHVVHRSTYRPDVPPAVHAHPVDLGRSATFGRLLAQNRALPALCRTLRPDAVLAGIPSTAVLPLPCPKVLINHDHRHELRPEQFGRAERAIRRVSYSTAFRQAAGVANISARTRDDLLRSRPWIAFRAIGVAHHGTDHLAEGACRPAGAGPAITFGQYSNKHVDAVVRAWGLLRQDGVRLPLRVLGLGGAASVDTTGRGGSARDQLAALVADLGLDGQVELLPWLDDAAFARLLAEAGMTVLASDFEGFGLPALEAMRLGMPLVYTPDEALREVTGGHGTPAASLRPDDIAAAVHAALAVERPALEAAQRHAATFTWARAAGDVRALVEQSVVEQSVRARVSRRRGRR